MGTRVVRSGVVAAADLRAASSSTAFSDGSRIPVHPESVTTIAIHVTPYLLVCMGALLPAGRTSSHEAEFAFGYSREANQRHFPKELAKLDVGLLSCRR